MKANRQPAEPAPAGCRSRGGEAPRKVNKVQPSSDIHPDRQNSSRNKPPVVDACVVDIGKKTPRITGINHALFGYSL